MTFKSMMPFYALHLQQTHRTADMSLNENTPERITYLPAYARRRPSIT